MAANILPRQAPNGPLHPPYPAKTAALGGLPTVGVDVPISTVFLVLFLIGAVSHMTILQINQKRGHKFLMSGMIFGFCMARIMSCILRIAWATHQTNIRLAIAAQVFVAAGVVLLFIVNLIFAQRIIRAAHPHSGWHPLFAAAFKAIYILIVLSLIMLIASVIQSFYTLNANTRRIDRDILLYGQTFYTVISFLPIPLVLLGLVIPRSTRLEKFGSGRFRSKIAILLVATATLCLGAAFRAGTNYLTPRPVTNPAWYHSKACFYIFNFTVEVVVTLLYVVVRVDRRFWVPNGARGAGDYAAGGKGVERGIMPEEEVFDDVPEGEVVDGRKGDVEEGKGAEGEVASTSTRDEKLGDGEEKKI
ncbi:MAG: hypothetical protein Q9195_007734 [Heterodermia aff. obscurata]